jgi:dual specificity tyrosine-phosphorylation-regulated kinase 2/3/4
MEITKKNRVKNNSDTQNRRKKYSGRISDHLSIEKKKTVNIKDSLSLSLSNSLKKIVHANSASNLKASSIYSPKAAIGYLPYASGSKKVIRNSSNSSLQSNTNLRSYISTQLLAQNDPKMHMSSRVALTYFKLELTEYEKAEILDYQDIYYFGRITNKLKPNSEAINYGFDDERGDYLLIAGDHIAYRYEIIKMLGKGNFGQVVLCEDHKRHEKVALKIVRNKKRFNQQATVEIKILQTLRENDLDGTHNIVKIKNYFVFRKHICMTFDQLSMNLYELLHKNNFEGLSLSLITHLVYQLLMCLDFAYRFEIIHCDLKPENIMLVHPDKYDINVIDFGSSCFLSERLYTYIQSRFYRAPEIILGIPYTPAIDMWSLGCIVAEFYTGYPLFIGESEHDQLLFIMETIGLPPLNVLLLSTRSKLFFESNGSPKIIPNKKGIKRMPSTKKLSDTLNGAPSNLLDFVTKCLDWDPNTRMKPFEGLEHPWIKESKKVHKSKEKKLKK